MADYDQEQGRRCRSRYDFVFDVELGGDSEAGGGRSAKLPFNKGQNPMTAAVAFLRRENLGNGHMQQVTGGRLARLSRTPANGE